MLKSAASSMGASEMKSQYTPAAQPQKRLALMNLLPRNTVRSSQSSLT